MSVLIARTEMLDFVQVLFFCPIPLVLAESVKETHRERERERPKQLSSARQVESVAFLCDASDPALSLRILSRSRANSDMIGYVSCSAMSEQSVSSVHLNCLCSLTLFGIFSFGNFRVLRLCSVTEDRDIHIYTATRPYLDVAFLCRCRFNLTNLCSISIDLCKEHRFCLHRLHTCT